MDGKNIYFASFDLNLALDETRNDSLQLVVLRKREREIGKLKPNNINNKNDKQRQQTQAYHTYTQDTTPGKEERRKGVSFFLLLDCDRKDATRLAKAETPQFLVES